MGRAFVCTLMLFASSAFADASMQIDSVDVVTHGDRTDVLIKTSGAPVFQSYARKDPNVLIVDVFDAKGTPRAIPVEETPFQSAKQTSEKARDGRDMSRFTFALKKAVRYDVVAERETVRISFWLEAGKTAAKNGKKIAALDRKDDTATDAPMVRLAQGEGGDEEGSVGASTDDGSTGNGKYKMSYIGFKNFKDSSRVFARMSEAGATFDVKKEGTNLLVIEIKDAFIPLRNNKNHLDTTYFEAPVKMITPGEVEGSPTTIRIVVEMKEDVPFEKKADGREIAVTFKR